MPPRTLKPRTPRKAEKKSAGLPSQLPTPARRSWLVSGSVISVLVALSAIAAASLALQKMNLAMRYADEAAERLSGAEERNADLSSQLSDAEALFALKSRAENAAVAPSVFLSVPSDWPHFTIPSQNLTFAYPPSWGTAEARPLKTDKGGGMSVEFGKAPDVHLYLTSSQYAPTPTSPSEFSLPRQAPAACDELTVNGKEAEGCLGFKANGNQAFIYSTKPSGKDLYGNRWSAAYYTGNGTFPILVGMVPKSMTSDMTVLGRVFSSIR